VRRKGRERPRKERQRLEQRLVVLAAELTAALQDPLLVVLNPLQQPSDVANSLVHLQLLQVGGDPLHAVVAPFAQALANKGGVGSGLVVLGRRGGGNDAGLGVVPETAQEARGEAQRAVGPVERLGRSGGVENREPNGVSTLLGDQLVGINDVAKVLA